jgi:hypothetical protein
MDSPHPSGCTPLLLPPLPAAAALGLLLLQDASSPPDAPGLP